MRVLLVLDDGTTASARATAARNWRPIFEELRTAGDLDLDVAALRTGEEMLAAAGAGGTRVALDVRRHDQLPRAALRLRALLRSGRYDIVHAHEVLPALVASGAARSSSSRPRVLFHRHHGHARGMLRVAGRAASLVTDLTVAVSGAVRDHARGEGTPEHHLVTVHNGVPEPRPVAAGEARAVRASLGLADDAPLAVWVGRLRAEKRVDRLIEATRASAGVHVAIVGDGPAGDRLRDLAAGSTRIRFVGFQPDVTPWLAAADVAVSTSPHEACPLSVLEAMATGRPFVAPPRDGFLELVDDGVTGLLAEPEDAAAFGSAMARIATDRALARVLGRNARSRYEQSFTVRAHVEGLLRVYRAVAGDPS